MFQRSPILTSAAAIAFLVAVGTAEAQVARVSGVVRDVYGEPLRAALVSAETPTGLTANATTDDNGRFTLIGLRPGVWKFEFQAPGYITETGQMSVRASGGQNRPVTVALRRASIPIGALGRLSSKEIQSDLDAAAALFDQQNWEAAIAAYRALLTKAPSLTAINLQIGAAERQRKNYDAAIQAYEALLATDPNHDLALIGISMTHEERGDLAAAERTLLEAAAASGAGRQVHYALGELQLSAGRADQAFSSFQKAVTADPSWGKPLYRLGELAMERGDTDGAARYLGEVIAVDPSSSEATLAQAALDRLNK